MDHSAEYCLIIRMTGLTGEKGHVDNLCQVGNSHWIYDRVFLLIRFGFQRDLSTMDRVNLVDPGKAVFRNVNACPGNQPLAKIRSTR